MVYEFVLKHLTDTIVGIDENINGVSSMYNSATLLSSHFPKNSLFCHLRIKIKEVFHSLLSELFLKIETMETAGPAKGTEIFRRSLKMLILERLKACLIFAVLKRLSSSKKIRLLNSIDCAMICETPEAIEDDMA